MRAVPIIAGGLLFASLATTCTVSVIVSIPSRDADALFPIKQEDAVQFIDQSGRKIGPKFSVFAFEFHEGLVNVGFPEAAYADKSGKIVISGFGSGHDFHDGVAAIEKDRNGKWGYVNKSGEFAIPPRFAAEPHDFHGGMAAVFVDHRVGYIDHAGEYAITPRFFDGEDLSEDFARVIVEGPCLVSREPENSCSGPVVRPWDVPRDEFPDCRYSFTDRSGNTFDQRFEDAEPFSEGLAAVKIGGKWGFIDKKGAVVIPARYSAARSFSEGLAPVSDGKHYGYIDRAGRFAIPARFRSAGNFHSERALVEEDKGLFYITPRGERAFTGDFYAATEFLTGVAQVRLTPLTSKNRLVAYIDTNGRRIYTYARGFFD